MRISGLYRMTPDKRREEIAKRMQIDPSVFKGLDMRSMDIEDLDGMIENVVGAFVLPVGIAANFVINGRETPVPMATEEPSVVAAASRIAACTEDFTARCPESIMIGQVQILDVPDMEGALSSIDRNKDGIVSSANAVDPVLVSSGGGAVDIETRSLDTPSGAMLIVHLLVDCRDAMGANAVNSMAEAVSPMLEDLTLGRALLRILSNLAVRRIATAEARFDRERLGGTEVVDDIMNAYHFACADPFRASTHNKGIMNGVSAVVRATGNDTRAVEAGAHAYASLSGNYGPLTSYRIDESGDLVGRISIPVPVGTVGGITKVHPGARACLRILGVNSASELGCVLASVGLAQNLAALRALSAEGIQRGHMKLHARNLAIQSGASVDEAPLIVQRLIAEGKVSASRARDILLSLRGSK
ncbi:MAG: hydroxymethylglutaryl-CoA reductase, degradative [Candidatus Thermoplasmatota archaeon]|nr:hydroxymethylglutaryl-CoA reductase, degradative [Candidatus Thermoplasmatota archaeon]